MDTDTDEYRVIRAPVGLVEFWQHLANDPAVASKVQVLEIQRETGGFGVDTLKPPLIPAPFLPSAHVLLEYGEPHNGLPDDKRAEFRNSELSLIAAVKQMSNLQSFRWDREPPLVDSVLDDDAVDDIWTALLSCLQLHGLDVTDASDNNDVRVRPIHESQVRLDSYPTYEDRLK